MRNGLRALLTSLLALGAPMLLSVACSGEDTTGPENQTGAVQVTATTSGVDLDPDGYMVALDGGSDRALARDGSTTFSSVAAGQHQVTLTGMAGNCSVTGANPVTASVSSGNTAQVTFEVVCEAPTGFVQVSTATTGDDLDPDGYTVTLDGGSDRSIGLNGVTTFSGVGVGSHQVELTGLAGNCSVDGVNPATTTVAAGATAPVSFAVVCEALPVGSLEVTATVTNNFDPDGYQIAVAGVTRGPVEVEGSAVFDDLPSGSQQVELRDIAPNCAVDGDNPATVTIPAGGTASAAFSVTCTSPPDGRIIFRGGPDYNGYMVMNADGSGRFKLLQQPPEAQPLWPAWSHDGNRIAIVLQLEWPNSDIYVMNKDASSLTQLTTDPASDILPTWSPDGGWIAFVSDRTGSEEIFVMGADGSGITQLTDDPDWNAGEPSWSPDGSKILTYQGSATDDRIIVMNADGSNVTRLNNPAPICDQGFNQGLPAWGDANPKWSPDGSRIVFQRNFDCTGDPATDEPDIFVMDADGTNIMNLTSSPGHEGVPRWSPDGTRILYIDGGWGFWVMNADGTDRMRISANGDLPDWGP